MNIEERILEALEIMHEQAKQAAQDYAEEQDIWFARGIGAAKARVQSILDGF